ncbi:MAG: hypothetical protein WC365_03655 [Candidatus Babeliales bacterium]|jgi:hypothetical protein
MNINPLLIRVKTALLSAFWGFIQAEYGIVRPTSEPSKKTLKTLNLQDFDFDSEILSDHLLDAAWATGELRLDQEGSDAASN